MSTSLPKVLHTYQNDALDSTRWARFQPRVDDIIISTSYKSGTTWMQEIVRQLLFQGTEIPERDSVALWDISFWLDARWAPLDGLIAKLEAQRHRRFIKSHLPLDGLPFYPQVKYIVVARDARDVAISMWNHYAEFTDSAFVKVNDATGLVGEPMPPPGDIHDYWRNWITRGWFEWESEGYPFWGNLHHTKTWWEYRRLPNILFVHYNDLKSNLAKEVRRIAAYLEIVVSDEALPTIMAAVHLDAMRDRAERLDPSMRDFWKDGATTFYFKGTNGRWKDILSEEEVALYDVTAAKVLTSDCRAWLEQGRMALT